MTMWHGFSVARIAAIVVVGVVALACILTGQAHIAGGLTLATVGAIGVLFKGEKDDNPSP